MLIAKELTATLQAVLLQVTHMPPELINGGKLTKVSCLSLLDVNRMPC